MSSASRPPTASAPPPTRRASVVPPKTTAPPPSKPTLSSSVNAKPTATGATRSSVVSPAGSVASLKSGSTPRPRASVSSESVRKVTSASRTTPTPQAKPAPAPAPRTTGPRSSTASISRTPARATPSISAIQEDGKATEELQNKLAEATAELTSKTNAVAELEGQIDSLKSSLEQAQADAQSKVMLADNLGDAKTALESQLEEARQALRVLQADHGESIASLESVRDELNTAKAATLVQNDIVHQLQTQLQVLEDQLSVSKDNLDALKASQGSSLSEAAAVASVEHDALIKAQADLKAIREETQALQAAHANALADSTAKISELKAKAALVEALESQVNTLKLEKEEHSGKLSELEVEILELKESQEVIEDERERLSARLTSLEEELSAALEQLKEQGLNHSTQLEESKRAHDEQVKAAAEDHAQVVASYEAVKAELASALLSHDHTRSAAQAADEEHIRQLEEKEQDYLHKQAELTDEIKRITSELEGQEAQYNLRVDAVKAEHDELLREAFERAKAEAGDAHTQELQSLRADSNATIEQIQAANQAALADIKAEHASTLESEVRTLDKQINSIKLDLKATQDDLSKAKAALEAARVEVVNLTSQRDEAHSLLAAASTSSPAQTEEVARVTRELSVAKDDLAAVTEMLNLTKTTLNETSENHTKELEEAAKSRAEEFTKLSVIHDDEVKALANQKLELSIKLSDLEGELATLKATVAAEPTVPKIVNNGAVPPQSSSVTKEDLQRMHEAHNLKLNDVRAEYEKMIRTLKEQVEAEMTKAEVLQQEVARKMMEIQYLEQDQDDSQEQITRYVRFFSFKGFVGGMVALAVIYGFF
ncbi:hypothetical protein BD779DRAFT_1430805 [Infundibulicybe gibba]|nr:hypothetical protein BD779DRAFT_1430805 [Infundibulicybe gibba]